VADAGAPEVAAQRRLHEAEELAQHTVLGQVADALERSTDGRCLCGRGRVVAFGRRQAQPEQPHQHGGDARLRHQRGSDRALAEREADLLAVGRIGTQHHHLVGAQAGMQHQAVEVVVVDRADEDLGEGLLEALRHLLCIGAGGPALLRQPQVEVVQRDRHLAVDKAMVVLAHHAHAHALEHRQAVGEHDRGAAPVDLQAPDLGLGAQRPVQRQRQRLLGRELRQLGHVGQRGARAHALAVIGRQGGGPALEQFEAARLAFGVDECVAQLVDPAPRRQRQPGLELPALDRGRGAGGRADHIVDARQRPLAQLHVELGRGAAQRLHQDALAAHAQLGGVALARHEQQARHEAVVRVAPQEQAQALAFAEREDAQRRLVQLVVRDLEQVVAREGLEDVRQRLGAVPARRQSGALRDRLDLAAQQRRLGHARRIRTRGEQAQEAMLAAHRAARVVALDADVVGVARAVDRRARVGLGHHQHRQRRARHRARCRRQHRQAALRTLGRALAQHAQAAAAHQAQRIAALVHDELVLAVAEQHHVVLCQPLEEGAALGHLRGGQRGGQRRVLGDRLVEPAHHRRPVGDGGTHVGQHLLERRHQRRALLGFDQPVDLDVHPRLVRHAVAGARHGQLEQGAAGIAPHGEDRVHDEVQRQAGAVDRKRRRVDEERHVVVDELEHRMPRRPAVLGQGGRERTQLRRAGRALRAELPQRQQRAGQVLDAAAGQFVLVELLEAGGAEGLEGGMAFGRQPRARQREQVVAAGTAQGLGRCVHLSFSGRWSAASRAAQRGGPAARVLPQSAVRRAAGLCGGRGTAAFERDHAALRTPLMSASPSAGYGRPFP